MVSRELLERIGAFLNEMFKDKITRPDLAYEIVDRPVPYLRGVEWHVNTDLDEGIGVHGLSDGRIEVSSHALGEHYGEALEIITADLYRRRLEKAKSEEEKERIRKEREREIEEVLDDLINKRWEKYLKDERLRRRYGTFIDLYWGEEVARRIREKYGMDIEFIVGPVGRTCYTSVFDPKGMSEDQIFEEIVKRVKMVYDAYNLNHNWGERKKFEEEFKEKWGLRKKRRRRRKS
ncbi:MAG: hypothetical protein QXR97_00385 [Thermoproteota archaeon]